MSVVRKLFFIALGIVVSANVWGQAASSPFTTFGIGEPFGNGLIHNQGMGGTGVAQPQYWFLNNQNPALLVYNTLTIFEAGILYESRTIKGDTTNERSRAGNMNYLATAFPIKPGKWTTSVGLMPYTNVEFLFANEVPLNDGSGTTAEVVESGSGGLTQLYWSNGVRISPDFSVGAKISYLFGSIENIYSNQLLKIDQVPYIVAVGQKSTVSDFTLGLGVSFSKDSLFNKDYRFSVGAVYNFEADLKAKLSNTFFRTNTAGDTIQNEEINNQHGRIHLPSSFSGGISFSKGLKWSISAEFFAQNWTSFSSINSDDEGLGKSWRASMGGEFTPDPLSFGSYLKRVTYRTGFSMEQYPFMANGKTVKDFGINFGLSLPAGRSSVDIAFKTGKRGNRSENLLEETYFKLYFGITFNDQWFIKRKFD